MIIGTLEKTNKIQQLVRDNTSNIFVQYSDTTDTQYASIDDGVAFTHNNKLYLLTYESSGLRGPDIWYYRINANTGEVEQFKKTIFSNKNIGIIGNRFQFCNSYIDINPDTGDIYFMLGMTTSGDSEMKLCKASTDGTITGIYDFTVPDSYNAEFLGYNQYNSCLYYVYNTDERTTKINKVTLDGIVTQIYSVSDSSRIQDISAFTNNFMVLALPGTNKLLVIKKETGEILNITGITTVSDTLVAYEVDNNTINISLGFSTKTSYTISISEQKATKLDIKNIASSSLILWSDDNYAYGLSYVVDKASGNVIESFGSYIIEGYGYVKNSNYEMLKIDANSDKLRVRKSYPVKIQNIDVNQAGILVKWVNKTTLMNISDTDLSRLSAK